MLVAASGGADSTALLLALHRIAPEFGLSLAVAHLHHGLRGADADADLESVRARCEGLGLPLVAARWDVRARMRRRGLAGQEGYRVLRREFLARARRRAGADAIATAHTADDQLETVLLRLLRGAGLPGLAGMRPRRGAWLKPLLDATRADVIADLRAAGVAWREDVSNASRDYARNRLRLDAIPALLRAFDPAADPERARAGFARRVARTAREALEAERALARGTRRLLRESARVESRGMALDSRRIGSYPVAARRIALRAAWRRLAGPGPGLTHQHLDALCRLVADGRSGSFVLLPDGIRAERRRDTVHFHRAASRRPMGRSHD